MRPSVVIDRPADRLLVDRAELLTGWVAPAPRDGVLSATCGGRPVTIRRCWHPEARRTTDVAGFWSMLMVQELLAGVEDDELAIMFRWDDVPLETLCFRVSPVAAHLARAFPLNLATYSVPRPPPSAASPVQTLVFPGLGGVGGASLNALLRRKMLEENWSLPVHFEANDAVMWASARATGRDPPRWIDGHACHGAADEGATSFARVTVLREPAQRLLSIFNYNRLVHPYDGGSHDVEAFLASDAAAAATQTVALLRCAGGAVDPRTPAAELAALARDELRRSYALVGITERFEETVFLLCQLGGYDTIGMWWKVLAAPGRPEPARLSRDARRRLDALVAADRLLYDACARDFAELVTARGPSASLARYHADAAMQEELPDVYKLVECLRWRQTLADAELRMLRSR